MHQAPIAPPLAGSLLLHLLVQISLLALLALCLGRLAMRCGLPAVVGELSTGVLLGPSVLGHLAPGLLHRLWAAGPGQANLLDAVSQLGVLLLVGVTGAYVNTDLLRRRKASVARIGGTSLLIPLGLGVAVSYLVPAELLGGADRTVFGCFIGVVMGVSAIPVIAKTLTDMRLLHRDVGQLTLASAAMADLGSWLTLSMVAAAATGGLSAVLVLRDVGSLAAVLLAAWLLGRPLVAFALRLAARSPGPGSVTAVVFVTVLSGAAGTQALGLEGVFGAFVAGLLIGPGAVDPARLMPLRVVTLSVLAPLFLATAGLRMDLLTLSKPAALFTAAGLCLVAVASKVGAGYLGARLSKLGRWEGLAIGSGLNARGVVDIVVASVGLRLGVLTQAMYTTVVLIALATSIMAAPLLRFTMRRVAQTQEEQRREGVLVAADELILSGDAQVT